MDTPLSMQLAQSFARADPSVMAIDSPILICLLGEFRVLKAGRSVKIATGSKTETLLCSLALRENSCALRDVLLASLWPDQEPALANQSLNSLIYNLRKLLGKGTEEASPVTSNDGFYCLNVEAGVDVDVRIFETLATLAARRAESGDHEAALASYTRAIELYRGDLRFATDVYAVILRERLRAQYLSAIAYVAEHFFQQHRYTASLDYAMRLLRCDPCREDAYRLAMTCHVRLGHRAEALQQYRLCEQILRSEFDAVPEPSTKALFDLIRLNPGSV